VKTEKTNGKATNKDEFFMRLALAEARRAEADGEVPVGAVVVRNGLICGRGRNSSIRLNDPTGHAEIRALRQACRKARNYRLGGCDLYVTLEPCAMCLGAAVQARVTRLVFGATDPKAGAVGSILRFPFEKINYRMEVREGVLARECGRILKGFFRKKRARPTLVFKTRSG
jgi:tRNA(adenine34) deaminase